MATYYKNYPTKNIGTDFTKVYEPTGVGVQSQVVSLIISNTLGSNVTISTTLTSKVYGTTIYLIKNAVIPTGNSLNIINDSLLCVENGDMLSVASSSTDSVDVLVSANEVYPDPAV